MDAKGPRYCPSIEDKIVRFADKESHQVGGFGCGHRCSLMAQGDKADERCQRLNGSVTCNLPPEHTPSHRSSWSQKEVWVPPSCAAFVTRL